MSLIVAQIADEREEIAQRLGRVAIQAELEHHEFMTFLSGGSIARVVAQHPRLHQAALRAVFAKNKSL